jgi:2-iminobutanoate/2-iminopropanoate deaminase
MRPDLLESLRIPVAAALCALLAAAVPASAGAAGPAKTEFLNSDKALRSDLPFSEAVRHGDTLYLSGQVGVEPGTLKLVPGGVRAEAKQALENIRALLASHGRSTSDILKCTVMLADIADWAAFNEVWRAFLKKPFPARSALGASGLALGARVEVECIASAGP